MSDDEKPPGRDHVIQIGPAEPDKSFPAIRITDDGITVGTLSPMTEGKSIGEGSILHLEPITGSRAYKATVLHEGRPGPAMVNSRAYVSGWDAVFGKSSSDRNMPN